MRIKWVLAYLDETGSLTSHERTRPAHESISVKDVICKVDVNRDGVLAAASARKLDKGGYSLQEHAAVALCSQDPGLLDVDKALAELLCDGSSLLAASSKSHEAAQVEAWVSKFFRGGVADILEVSWGAPVVSEAARPRGFRVPPCFTHLALSYGIAWDLEQDSHLQAISSAIDLFSPRALVVNLMRKEIPGPLLRLTLQSASLARGVSTSPCTSQGRKACGSHGGWTPGEQSSELLPIRDSLDPLSGLTPVSSCGPTAAELPSWKAACFGCLTWTLARSDFAVPSLMH